MVQVSITNGVMELILDRPVQKNALNLEMYAALAESLMQADIDTDIRVVIISGSEGNFSSGNDLSEFSTIAESMHDENFALLQFMHALKDCRKPIIAAVEGYAVGIGTTLLLHCDLIFANQDATFKLPFASLGLCPEYTSSFLLPLLVGHAKASEWLLLGEGFNANSALQAGLINAINDDPVALAKQKAKQISMQPAQAIQKTKALLKAANKPVINAVMKNEMHDFVAALQGDEFAEAAKAFLEKRPADFSKI